MATPIPVNHATFSLSEVVQATGGVLHGEPCEVRGVVTDSRAVEPGSLFVALRGERFDGHRFVGQAVSSGAGALVIASDADLPEPGVASVRVADTTTALGDLAAHHRVRWGRPVVAITGSAGKTSTKELVAAALDAGEGRVAKTRGNLNNLVGVPMTLFCLDESHEVAVIEMGTNAPGEIPRLGALGRPDVAVITLVSAAHTEGLGSLADVAREKTSLISSLTESGIAVLNADDAQLSDADLGGRRAILFGRDEGADVRLRAVTVDAELGTAARYAVKGVGEVEVRLLLLGEAAALNAAAALAVAIARGVDVRAAALRLSSVEPTPGRLCPLSDGTYCVIDDSYNANPRSTQLALETARAVADARGVGLVAVLADMKELGAVSAAMHREAADLAVEVANRGVVLVGPEMAVAARPGVTHVADAADAIGPARSFARSGDVILVKGSRSMTTERVVSALAGEGAP